MDLDTLTQIMNEFVEKNEVNVLIRLPEGTQEAIVEDNTTLGNVIRFFALLKGFKSVVQGLQKDMGIDKNSKEWANILDVLLGLLKEDILSENDDK